MYSDIGRSCKARRTGRSLHQGGGWPQPGWFWRHDQRLQMSVRKSRQCYPLFWLCLRCSAIFRFHLFLFSHSFSTSSSSSTYCRISPGWQSSALQIAFSVDSRTAFALLFFRIERFASVMSTSPASSVSPFLRFAIITSRLIMIMSFSSIRCSDRQVIFQLIGHSCIKDPGQHQRKKSRNHKYQDRDQYRRGQIKKQAQRSNCRNAETADSHPL